MTSRDATFGQEIGVGDLVQVIRSQPCCGNGKTIGRVFRVSEIKGAPTRMRCLDCGNRDLNPPFAVVEGGSVPGYPWEGYVLSRLKRIPPLSELEGAKQKEDIREPA